METDKTKEVIDKIVNDNRKITVGNAARLLTTLFKTYCEKTKSGKPVREKLTEEEYDSFFSGVAYSMLTSLYCTASKNKKELEKRLSEVDGTAEVAFRKVE